MEARLPALFTREHAADPYPVYRALRPLSPLEIPGSGVWALLRFRQVYDALRDHETFSSAGSAVRRQPDERAGFGLVLINDDPPRHTRFRRLVNRAFTPKRIEELEPWIESVAAGLLDEATADEVEFVRGYAVPLPVRVIAQLLGIPGAEHETFKRWSDAVVGTGGFVPREERQGQVMEMMAYFGKVVAEKRAAAAADLISALVEAEVEGERLREWEVLGFCMLLLIAGNETTTNLIGNMLNILARRPDLWERLRGDRSLIEPFIEETLRLESPVQGLTRTLRRDVEVAGRLLPEGATVLALYGAANRDPEEFPDPDEFRLDRNLSQHVAFGMGIHYCLGAPLARTEARVTLRLLLDRFAAIEPGSGEAVRQTGTPLVLGYSSLPLRLRRA
jgi:cytochrome P450